VEIPEGNVTFVNAVQPENVEFPREVMLEGIVMFARAKQPENAPSPIDVTLDGIVTLVIPHSLNAPAPMAVTGFPLIVAGISAGPLTVSIGPVIVIDDPVSEYEKVRVGVGAGGTPMTEG
jgi:hypothetical protein